MPGIDVQYEIIKDLRTDDDFDPAPLDRREADAWIYFLRLKTRQRALERLEVEAGDLVKAIGSGGELLAEVSSIGSTGRIHFKGGQGTGAWPDVVTVCCRKRDDGDVARALRRVAANQVASRARTDRWSLGKQAELEEFKVKAPLTRDDVEELQEVIEAARDEKPIQQLD